MELGGGGFSSLQLGDQQQDKVLHMNDESVSLVCRMNQTSGDMQRGARRSTEGHA